MKPDCHNIGGEALLHSAMLHNRTVLLTLNMETSQELLFKKFPRNNNVRFYRCGA